MLSNHMSWTWRPIWWQSEYFFTECLFMAGGLLMAECLLGAECLVHGWSWVETTIELKDHEEEGEMGEYSKGSFRWDTGWRRGLRVLFEDSSSEELEFWLLEIF